jgi:hypothetical protein
MISVRRSKEPLQRTLNIPEISKPNQNPEDFFQSPYLNIPFQKHSLKIDVTEYENI